MIQMMNNEIVMVRYFLYTLAVTAVGCAGVDGAQISDGTPPGGEQTTQPPLVTTDGGVPKVTQWAEKCSVVQDGKVYAMHMFPNLTPIDIYTHVEVYPALDIPVAVSKPLVMYGGAWYECGNVGDTFPVIVFNWT